MIRSLMNRAIDRIVRTLAPEFYVRSYLDRRRLERRIEVVVLNPCRDCNRYTCECDQ